MNYPYEALIEGKPIKINGVDIEGKYILDGGDRLELQSPDKLPIRSRPLKRVAKLTFDGQWFLDGKNIKGSYVRAAARRRESPEARSENETLFELMDKLDTMPDADRDNVSGVAWFVERSRRVEGETVEDCQQRKEFLANRGGCETIDPLPPADCFQPVLLADFGIINQKPMGDGHHGKSYEAVIEGQKQAVNSFGEHGGLVLADGQRYKFERLNFKPEGMPTDEPAGDIFGWRLLEVVRLESWGDDWKWNGEESLAQLLEAEDLKAGSPKQALEQPESFKRCQVLSELRKLENKAEVQAVAWFKHDDGADGWNTPIFLKSFRPLPPGLAGRSDAVKSVARFEKNFSITIIPQQDGQEKAMTVEPELQALVKKVIEAGGNVPRTKLRNGKSDNYQPEKLLMSEVAKALIKAGLLGSTKSGRTTVFWAKNRTD